MDVAQSEASCAAAIPHAIDRASALFTLLANARSRRWLLRWLWLLLQTLLRALGFVLGKAPREAAAETAAVGTVLLRPRRLRVAVGPDVAGARPQRPLRGTLPAAGVNSCGTP